MILRRRCLTLVTRSNFRNLQEFLVDGELISSDKIFEGCKSIPGVKYLKRDFLFGSGIWRNEKCDKLSYSKYYHSKTLVMGHSDLKTGILELLQIRKLGFRRVFSTNILQIGYLSAAMPLGLSNFTQESDLHLIHGNEKHLELASDNTDFPESFNSTVYLCFTVSTNPTIRKPIFDFVNSVTPNINHVREDPDFSNTGRIEYLANLRRSSFVICPEGNGYDTHRLWETLYMGGFPIVTKNKFMNSLYKRLPVLLLDNWQDLSTVDFESEWYRLREYEWDADFLRKSYWINQIKVAALAQNSI